MQTRNIFQNISALDHRYALSEKAVFEILSKYLSEEASVQSFARTEVALIKAHLAVRGKLTDEIVKRADVSTSLRSARHDSLCSIFAVQFTKPYRLFTIHLCFMT